MHIGFWTENCTEVRWSINIGSMISAFLFFIKKLMLVMHLQISLRISCGKQIFD